ncbi:MAG: hypothetical protein ACOX84_10075 [Methanothrix sp.]
MNIDPKAMRLIEMACVLSISLLIASVMGCIADESEGSLKTNPDIPKTMLPDGFKLLAALPEMDPSVNMTEYITKFYGEKKIEPLEISVGIYQWEAKGGIPYDAKITYIRLPDEEQALAAIDNFRSQGDYVRQLSRGLDIFGNATVNGHDALEIRHIQNSESYKYIYLWNNVNVVVLTEGNNDRDQSLQLAAATGL